MTSQSDLPFGSEFSPSQIDLRRVLELAKQYAGDRKGFEAAIRQAYFEHHSTSEYNRAKLANNTRLGMIAYGIIDREARLTDFGEVLYAVREDELHLYRELGRHILLHLHGTSLVQCVRDMQAADEPVTLVSLRRWLAECGIRFPSGGKHPSIMRLWLEKAGVFTRDWHVDDAVYQSLVGIPPSELDALAGLGPERRAFLKALVNMGTGEWYVSSDVARFASAVYGVNFNEKNLPKDVLYPLKQAGYIVLERGTKQPGRGAKPFLVTPSTRLVKEVIEPLFEQLDQQVAPEIRPLLRKSLQEILMDIDSKDRHIRGLALEALAFKLMRLIDLIYVGTRLRGTATGGAEVDVIFESDRLVFSRWQVQCKNTAQVSLDDVAKEVGLTHLLKSNVVVVVTTGQIGPKARSYADQVMKDSNLCVVMIDGRDIAKVAKNPVSFIEILHREAKQAMAIKKISVVEGHP